MLQELVHAHHLQKLLRQAVKGHQGISLDRAPPVLAAIPALHWLSQSSLAIPALQWLSQPFRSLYAAGGALGPARFWAPPPHTHIVWRCCPDPNC